MKTLDEVFDENAKKTMVQWNLGEFKQTHPRLYSAIIASMKECQDGGITKANYFRGDNELYRDHHKDESLRLQRVLVERGFVTCGIGDAEGLWMHYSDEHYAAGFIGMPESDDDLYECVKEYLNVVKTTPLG